ncbi:MAG: TolC family protein [Fimbriimonadaceae bacterium]|nr:TolC family protein [Fimbriimonadaceae bacterium]
MITKKILPIIAALAASTVLSAQPITAEQFVQESIKNSLAVKAAQARLEQSNHLLKSSQSPFNPQIDIAPGVGFTNSNAILSQEFDIFGRRNALSGVYAAQSLVANAELMTANLGVAANALEIYAELLWAQESLTNAEQATEAAEALVQAVKKRVEIGEAPEVHLTRAEVELARTRQQQTEAQALVAVALVSANSLVAQPLTTEMVVDAWVDSPRNAIAASPELLLAAADLGLANSELASVKKQGKPRLTAGIASDIWSIDRDMVKGDNFGLQINLSAPILDRGENRFAVKAAESEIARREANLKEAERIAQTNFERARIGVESTESIRQAFQGDIVPKGEQMVEAMRSGYESGLITLIEVLEAQQALNRLKLDRLNADRKYRLAQIELMKATNSFPGLEVAK